MNNPGVTYIVDDDGPMRESLCVLLKTAELQVTDFETAEEFLDRYNHEHPACLILDQKMPGMTGIDLQRELISRHIHLPIIFLTGHGDVPTVVNAMKQGAVDFLEKPVDPEHLLECVHAALDQDRMYSEDHHAHEVTEARLSTLTPRERQVLKLVVKGKTSKQIATELFRSEKTIQHHRARVMRKLQVHNVAQLVSLTSPAFAETDDDKQA